MREIGIGLLGLGNVGAGVVRLLHDNAQAIEARVGAKLVIRGIAVRDPEKARLTTVDTAQLTTDAMEVVLRDDVDIVVELIGGETLARDLITAAIAAGKHVVTANKALLAVHGDELYAAAEAKGIDLYYEAAVCGGIPIIRALREGLASDRIESIIGIVNGTSNFITCAMSEGSREFADVLQEAQDMGYAEADPSLDIGGGDAAHKLAILAMLSFGCRVDYQEIHVEGIESLTALDYQMAKSFGYVIKSLAIGHRHDDGLDLRVHPALVPQSWLLADVPDSKNALYVESYALGSSMYYGAGAGMMPTAMSVVSDIIEVARNLRVETPARTQRELTQGIIRNIEKLHTRYYLRFSVPDRPGILGQLTTILGQNHISISELSQNAQYADGDCAAIIALTHEVCESDLRAALTQIQSAGLTAARTAVIRIADANL